MSKPSPRSPHPPDPRRGQGQQAELWAADELRRRGWVDLVHDWRSPFAQVDLVGLSPCQEWRALIEVKARHPLSPASCVDLVKPSQLRRLLRAAAYLEQLQAGPPVRVDLVLVHWLHDQAWSLHHFEDLAAGQ